VNVHSADKYAMMGFQITHIVTETTAREEHSSLWDVDSTTNTSDAEMISVTTFLNSTYHSLWARSGESRKEFSDISPVVGVAFLCSRIGITIANTAISRGEHHRDSASAQSCHASANPGRIGIRNGLLVVTVTGRYRLRKRILRNNIIEPLGYRRSAR